MSDVPYSRSGVLKLFCHDPFHEIKLYYYPKLF